MIEQVGAFADELGIVACHGGECRLDSFLAHFLRDAADSAGKEPGRVAAFRAVGDTLRNRRLQRREERNA